MPDSSNNVNSGVRASAVDWSRPIEAVHEDGRVVPTQVTEGPDRDGDFWVKDPTGKYPKSGVLCCRPDGGDADGWRIRNVQPTTPERDPLRDRMEALVRRVAKGFYLHAVNEDGIGTTDAVVQAQGIVRDLPKPVDPDLIEAREVVMQVHIASGMTNTDRTDLDAGKHDDEQPMLIALAAIKRGRALAAPEVSHVG